MSELVKVGKTMKGTFQQMVDQGFLDQFPGSVFRDESTFSLMGDVYIKSELVSEFNQHKEEMLESNGHFPIL